MEKNKSYTVCAGHFNNGTIETIQVRIITDSPESAKEGAIKYWNSKGIEPFFLGTPFDVVEEGHGLFNNL